MYLVSLWLDCVYHVEPLCGQQLPPLLMSGQAISFNGASVLMQVFSSGCRALRAVLSTFDTLSATGAYCVRSVCQFGWNVCSLRPSENVLERREGMRCLESNYQVV